MILLSYIDADVTILSALVGILIAWNIYTLVDLKSYKKELSKMAEDKAYDAAKHVGVDIFTNTIFSLDIGQPKVIVSAQYLAALRYASDNGERGIHTRLLQKIDSIILTSGPLETLQAVLDGLIQEAVGSDYNRKTELILLLKQSKIAP